MQEIFDEKRRLYAHRPTTAYFKPKEEMKGVDKEFDIEEEGEKLDK